MNTSPKPTNNSGPLDFASALIAVRDGAKITKAEWNDQQIYIFLSGYLKIHRDGEDKNLIVSDGDMIGEDWYILNV